MNDFNAHMTVARRAKADALIDFIWGRASKGGRLDLGTVSYVRNASRALRDMVAEEAGQHRPSDETWALVVAGISERIDIARWAYEQGRADREAEMAEDDDDMVPAPEDGFTEPYDRGR